MQTIDRPTPERNRRPGWAGPTLSVLCGVAVLAVLVLSVLSRVGALIVVALVLVTGLAIWTRRKGLVFAEIAAFLIHFDGLGLGPIRMGRIVALSAVLLIIYKLVSGWRPPAIPPRHWMSVMAFSVWAVFSGLWSSSSSSWFFAIGLFGLGVVFFCITALLVDSDEMLQRYLRAYWIGGLFGSAAGILALFLGTRSVGFGGDPNYFGILQASLIPLTVYYRRHAPDARMKHFYSFALLFVLAGAAGAGSRSGLIGGAIVIVATMVTRPGLDAARRARVGVGALVIAAVAFLVGFVANPANLQRGFQDRGAGRLDLWNVALSLIGERPLIGWGLGQMRLEMIPSLLTTPGSMLLEDTRSDVSAHNTWMDVTGDLGLIGLILFVSVFAIALGALIWPRRRKDKEIATVLFVMMLPVLSGSMFLPLLNNKLSWSIIGLAAALQVPSWNARWSGLSRTRGPAPPGASLHPVPLSTVPGTSPALAPSNRTAPESRRARWDLKVSRRFRVWILFGAVSGALVLGVAAGLAPMTYEASTGVFVPQLQRPEGQELLSVSRSRLQGVLTTPISTAYAAQLKELSGIDLEVPEIVERMSVTRPEMGAYVGIHFSDTDRANTEAVLPYLVPAMDAVYDSVYELAREQTANEIRPIVPGEQRFYSGDFYLRTDTVGAIEETPPRTVWLSFIGFVTGALVAAGLSLAQQRRPRVNNDDDFDAVLDMPLWSHIGRSGRRGATSRGQFAQISVMAAEHSAGEESPRRFVVTSARRDAAARRLAVGLAGELVAEGRRVLLVDAQVGRPLLSARLGRFGRRGLADVAAGEIELGAAIHEVRSLLLPRMLRRAVRRSTGELRFLPAGRRRKDPTELPLSVLDPIDPDVTIVLLAPPVLGDISVNAVLGWGDAVVLAVVEGRTVTFDAEDAAGVVRTFSAGTDGVVLLDV